MKRGKEEGGAAVTPPPPSLSHWLNWPAFLAAGAGVPASVSHLHRAHDFLQKPYLRGERGAGRGGQPVGARARAVPHPPPHPSPLT